MAMSNTLEKILMVVTLGKFVIDILRNGFIGLPNCIDWIRNKKLCLIGFILSLAFERISQLRLTIVNLFSMLLYQKILVTMERNHTLTSVWMLANHLSTWLATCLTVFFPPKDHQFLLFTFPLAKMENYWGSFHPSVGICDLPVHKLSLAI